MSLVTVSEVMTSMGINPDLEGEVEGAITGAVAAAQLRLETELDSRLDALVCVDTFYVDFDRFSGVTTGGVLALRLKNGFLADVSRVAVCPTLTGEFATATGLYRVQKDHGFVYVGPEFDRQFVQVEYTCGYASAEVCPPAMKKAVLYFVPTGLKIAQPVDEKKKELANDTAAVAQGLISSLSRPYGMQFRPLLFTAEPAA